VKALSRANYGLLLAIIGMLIFSGTVPATRLAVKGLDAYFVTAARAAIAGVLAAIMLAALRRSWPSRAQLRLMLVCAVTLTIRALMLRNLHVAMQGDDPVSTAIR